MIPSIAALCAPDTLACTADKALDHRRGDGVMVGAVEQGLRAVGTGSRLIADDLKAGDALLEHQVRQDRRRSA